MNITGWQAAFYGHVFGTQQSRDEVFSYYQRELIRLGWKTTHNPILSTVEVDGWAWCKPQLFYRLTIIDPTQYERVGIPDAARFRTVYDARLQGVTGACPAP